MGKKLIRQVMGDLYAVLTEKRFSQKFTLTPKETEDLLLLDPWTQILEPVFPIKKRLGCGEILSLCEGTLARLSPEPEEGWLPFSYQYARRLLFPDVSFSVRAKEFANGALFLLSLMQVLFSYERRALHFDPLMDFSFLSAEELEGCERAGEYRRFLDYFKREYVYELMRLGREVTPFHTLEHIAGVHYVAMTVARGLMAGGVGIDLSLISGAAAGHDIGKFGCKPNERVPYLHYYYTDRWFSVRGMGAIGHIAANHSTWDLELENLSAESLSLIYADFRVKQSRAKDGHEITQIYSLDDSFEVILQMLDNLDETKRRRYRFVYAKLHDFEDFMEHLGVDIGLTGKPRAAKPKRDVALMGPGEVIESLVFLAVEHNLGLMHLLGEERQFGNILEAARSEKNWKRIRAYLDIFEEYNTYLSSAQKEQTLAFLYELLMHREGDIRRQAAGLIGSIIARFNIGYRKELPAGVEPNPGEQNAFLLWAQYLDMIVHPDHKLTPQHKSWVGYTLKIMVGSVLERADPKDSPRYLSVLLRYYDSPELLDEDAAFALLDSMLYLPLASCPEETLEKLVGFAGRFAGPGPLRLCSASMRFLKHLVESLARTRACCRRAGQIAKSCLCGGNITLIYLQNKILSGLGLTDETLEELFYGRDVFGDIFLENLKTATPWVIKAINIELLVDQIARGRLDHLLHVCAHLSNLVKVSERVVVRHDAGAALLGIAPLLSLDQRNEIAVELAKGLEVGEYEFSKYIPEYLGELMLYLHPKELDELISHLGTLLCSSNNRIVSVALGTVGVVIECYSGYRGRFDEEPGRYEKRREVLLGMLLDGLANYREVVHQEALLVTGKMLFGSKRLSAGEKAVIFSLCHKKFLFLIAEKPAGELTFFYRAAALSHLYRFITARRVERGEFKLPSRGKVAFFPGTFDPFTLSHKGIVESIRDQGFEVFLAIDEFSWSKKTQPHLIRRQIVSMSVAGMFHVHLFPDDIPVNLANPMDLKKLTELFAGREVYIAVGSDVVANASSYRGEPGEYTIHRMNHIVFRRTSLVEGADELSEPMLARISGKVVRLALPNYLEDISSTRIRENIDLNRDIRNLIAPSVQEFIYQNSLYLREPQYKQVMRPKSFAFDYVEHPAPALFDELSDEVLGLHPDAEALCKQILEAGDSLLLLRNREFENRVLGFVSMREISSSELYGVLKKVELAEFVRGKASGKILLVTGLYNRYLDRTYEIEQLLLTEALALSLARDCCYGIFYPYENTVPAQILSVLERQGFLRMGEAAHPLYAADMHAPVVLIQNIETTIKEPFCSSEAVLSAVRKAHRRLQRAMADMYAGTLVLSLSAGIIHQRLVDQITALNGVPSTPVTPRVLGPNMCVPFGKIMRGKVIPNTVTKTLHTDKVFTPDIAKFTIEAFPYYSPLESQIRMIKSFDRPVILVDDLMHGGERLLTLGPLFKQEGIEIKKVLVGLLSGLGRDLMSIQELPVESVYYVPNLRRWFVESTLYPFIGGDTVKRDERPVFGMLPSVNRILPYASPFFSEDGPRGAAFELSRCCLENAYEVLSVLEAEYRDLYARNLTLNRLSEAVILPLCPDKGGCMSYDPNLAASVYLKNDLEMLLRTRQLML